MSKAKSIHGDLLGRRVTDRVTGAEGVVESVSYDLYGCVQAVVRGKADEKGAVPDGRWFDVKRLIVSGGDPVMAVPEFAGHVGPEKGPADKPAYERRS